jgi:hypothetical protein
MKSARLLLLSLLLTTGQAACGGGERATEQGGAGGTVVTGAGGASSASGSGTGSPATSSGSASGGGGHGGGEACPAAGPFDGAPIDVTPEVWTWVDVPGAKCRDGSQTGFGIRLVPGSTKLFLYLEGGGACFNGATCAVSLGAFGEAAFGAWRDTAAGLGLFDATRTDNPFADYNAVYVPYCTGDVHGGSVEGVSVPGGPADQHFVGYRNIGLFLDRLVPTFANASHVVVTGVSAGGFGAALNYDRVASAFCPTPVTLIDDSGPPMSDAYLAPCLQKQWRELWDLDAALPPDCTQCTSPDGGGIANYAEYLAGKWKDRRFGLISSTRDAVISAFFGFGADDCTSVEPLSGSDYAEGLDELRDLFIEQGTWGTYFVDSISHTYVEQPAFYTTTVDGKALTTWVSQLLDGEATHIGP